MKSAIFTTLLLLFSIVTFSQSVQSTVVDGKNGQVIEMATVRLLKKADSTFVQGVQTDMKGNFNIPRVAPGHYILVISSVGYNEHKQDIQIENRNLILRTINLTENVQLLKEIDVKGTAAQLVVKGDTVEYNAAAFKLQENAVVEDLLKRLPGVEVSSDGKITVNGQDIKRIRVDGKKFFDGDIEMATKNLTADMIDKVQVLEQKSEMAQLTGFEDDNTERIINLTTKPNRRNGYFGNAIGGIGLDIDNNIRYDANANFNLMRGESQTSIVAGANNVNTARSSRGRWGGQSSGITETQNIGLNNNTIINPNLKIGGDGSFTHSNNYTENTSLRESYLRGLQYNDSTKTISGNDSYAANMRLEVEWKIDTLRTLIVQPRIEYSEAESYSLRDFLYLTQSDSTSWGYNNNNGFERGLSGGLNIIYNKKSTNKKGRTMTINVSTNLSDNNSDRFNLSLKNTFDEFRNVNQLTVDQFTQNKSNTFNNSIRVSFVEPLWNNKNMLETALQLRANQRTSEINQYIKDENNLYNVLDSAYSNNFSNLFLSQILELNYRYTEKDYNLTLGLKAEPSQTKSETLYGDGSDRIHNISVFNFAPNARFQYNFTRKTFLRIDYRGRTEQPSINQMQPVKNNSNLMNETIGNPNLNPSFNNQLSFNYSAFNDQKFSSFNTMLRANLTKDALVTNSIFDKSGKQYIQTVNAANAPFSIWASVMYNTPIIQKRLHFNTNTSTNFSQRFGYSSKGMDDVEIDTENLPLGDLSITDRIGIDQNLSLTFTHDKVEFGLRGGVRYSNTQNSLTDNISQTYDWSGRSNIVIRFPYDFSLSSDITYTARTGYGTLSLNELLWNASLDKNLFKNRAVLSVKWFDILQQQKNIRQNIGDNSIQYTTFNTLRSYFLVSFSYRLNKFAGGSNQNTDRPRGFGDGRGPGGGRGMGRGMDF